MKREQLAVQLRTATGKGAARQMRLDGRIPAICYGTSIEEPIKISLTSKQANHLLSHGIQVVDLDIDGTTHSAIIKDYQKDPIKGNVEHIDFQIVAEDQTFKIDIPVKLLNTIKSHGVRMGGQLVKHVHKLPIRTTLAHMPDQIEVDIIDLTNKQSALVRNIQLEGVEILTPGSVAICSISKARAK